jgi:1-acyl-sn-glycerol-3-phosphate acyltransferase
VLPVGLSYVDAERGGRHDAPLFIGDTTLLQSLWNTLRATGVQAVVHYGEPQRAERRDRRTWAQDLRDAVTALREG